MGEILIKSDFELFSIDHDRENNPDTQQVIDDIREEQAYMQEMILQKFVMGELDILSLSQMLRRLQDITYFLGRLEGEKFKS